MSKTSNPVDFYSTDDLFAGNGEMRALMRSLNWSHTPIGNCQEWSSSLRTAISICLSSCHPLEVLWGADYVRFYNDACCALLGQKHPQFLGRPGRECWTEIWDQICSALERVWTTGEPTNVEDVRLRVNRNGSPEDAYFTCSYSPIWDERGNLGGIFCAWSETTHRVLHQRELMTLQALTTNIREIQAESTLEGTCQTLLQALANNPDDIPFALIYQVETHSPEACLVATTGLPTHIPIATSRVNLTPITAGDDAWNLAQIWRSGQPQLVENRAIQFGLDEPDAHPPQSAQVMPLLKPGQPRQVIGFLVLGINPLRRFDHDYQGFFELVANQAATALATTCTSESLHWLSSSLETRQEVVFNILESITDAFVAFDTDWRFTYVNQEAAKLLRKSREELLGKEMWRDVFAAGPEVLSKTDLQEAIATQTTINVEKFSPTLNRWLEIRAYPAVGGLSVYFRDITDTKYSEIVRRQNEIRLQEHQHLLEQVTETVPGILYVYDLIEQRNIYVNGQVIELLGYTVEQIQIMGHNLFLQLVHPDDMAKFPAHMRKFSALKDGEVLENEYRMRDAHGEWRWFSGREIVFSRTPTGAPRRILGSAYDITPQKANEKRQQFLLELNNQIRVLSNPQEIMWVAVSSVAQELGISRCAYGELDFEQASLNILQDSCHTLPYGIGKYPLKDFGPELIETLHRQTISIDDVQTHPLTTHQHLFKLLQIRAALLVPLFKQGKLVAVFLLQNSHPRTWLADEIALVEQVVELTWLAADKARTEGALRQSEARFQRLATNVPGVICRYLRYENGSEAMLYVSPSCRNLFELEADTIQQNINTLWSLIHTDDLQSLRELIAASAETQQSIHWEGQYTTPSGRTRWIQMVARPEHQTDGSVLWDGLLTDITGTKEIEIEREHLFLRSQQYANQLKGLTEAALVMNSVLSVEEVMQAITEQARTIVGTQIAITTLVEDQHWADAISTLYLSPKYNRWDRNLLKPDGTGIAAQVCASNQPLCLTQAELEAHPNGIPLEAPVAHYPLHLGGWLAAPLTGRNGHNIGLIQLSDKESGEFTESDKDILVQLAQMASVAIENTRLYEAEQTARTHAESANRIKDEFLAVLSHELRTPLNPILGWSRLMRSRKLSSSTTDYALETIERNAKLQTQLIEDLLDVSRILQGKMSLEMSAVDLAGTIQAAMETVRLASEAKSINIHQSLQPDVGKVLGDPNRLQQVVWNLLSNAVKFTPANGSINITLTHTDTCAQITVTDTGRGIEPEFMPHIFEYFRQEDGAITRKFGGLGLGLAIVRHIVELHGGTVQAESPGAGQGATFTVRIPVLKPGWEDSETESCDSPNAPQLPSLPLTGLSILVVDDDADSRELITFILEQAGAKVTFAGSASAAIAILTQQEFDVLVSDLGMPEVDGYMLIQQIRTEFSGEKQTIPAIALTAYAGESDQRQAMAAGFQAHLAKPIEPNRLIATVAQLMKRSLN